jgi:hypothetical protein
MCAQTRFLLGFFNKRKDTSAGNMSLATIDDPMKGQLG